MARTKPCCTSRWVFRSEPFLGGLREHAQHPSIHRQGAGVSSRTRIMLDRSELALAVGHADVAMQMGFSGAAAHFHFADSEWWKDVRFLKEVSEPLTLKERCLVVVE